MKVLGYNKYFLGKNHLVNLPKITLSNLEVALNNGEVFKFTHFSLVMNKILKSAIYVASNIDKEALKTIKRKNAWHYDNKIGASNQLGNELYKDNEWDRGHLARRKDICWGSVEEATLANYDSFCWANICLQHKKFNQGIWSNLENFIFDKIGENSSEKKLSVFTGPINGEGSIKYCGVNKPLTCNNIIPLGFWKTIFYVDNESELKSLSFIINQDKYFSRSLISEFKLFSTYQVSLEDIIDFTGLEFDYKLLKTDVINNSRSCIINTKDDLSI